MNQSLFHQMNGYASSFKYGVQIRQLRKDHPDGRYVNVLQQYAKEFAIKYGSVVSMVSVDDKVTSFSWK